jgi:protein involved in polysaccharide export with SLBB domain
MRQFLAALMLLVMCVSTAHADESQLRIGDILTISLPGEPLFNKEFQIDRKGNVLMPEVGAIEIVGKTLPEASAKLREQLSRAFRDLSHFSVTIKERRLLVSVHGYVKQPGTLELSGDATIQTAIVAAGGLVQGAQLDKLLVLRKGAQKIEFDYKRYLDTGDDSALPRLQPLDTIFVPASPLTGKVQIEFDGRTLAASGDGSEERTSVKVFGEVNTPAIFAFKTGANVIDFLMRAGGVTRYASVDQIRVINDGKPIVFNLQGYLDTGDKKLLPQVQPGATIFVPKQLEEIRRGAHTVYVMGEVAKPGAFDTKDGATFIDILANAGGPTRFSDTRMVRIIRADGKVETVDLAKYAEGKGGQLPPVLAGDTLFVPEKNETTEPSWLKIPPQRAVQVMGAVSKPGRFEWSNEMTLFDLLAQAGGPNVRADISSIDILRNENDRGKPIKFNLKTFLKDGGSMKSVPKIKAGYVIMVPELPQNPNDTKAVWVRQTADRSIYVMGQVGIPGRYAFNNQLNFLDIITAANGPTSTADLRNIRVSHRGGKGSSVSTANLALYFATGDEKLLPKVKPGDVIYVPDRNKDYLDQPVSRTVRLLGSVARPGRYQFNDDMSVLDVLAEAGGPTEAAMPDKIIIVNFSTAGGKANLFNLVDFAKTGDFRRVPDLRAGDLVFVPNQSQSAWKRVMDDMKDLVSAGALVSMIKLLK